MRLVVLRPDCRPLGRRAVTTLEFALVAPVFMILLWGSIEFARMAWTQQALQVAGDQTARCVAIGGAACTNAVTYATGTAVDHGAFGLLGSGVQVDTVTNGTVGAGVCRPPIGNLAIRIRLSLSFTSVASTVIPVLPRILSTTSCYPTAGN